MWDPNPTLFTIPIIRHPVTWYGVLFAFGFLVGYFLVRRIFSKELEFDLPEKDESTIRLLAIGLTDRIAMLVILGGIIGARLGHAFSTDGTIIESIPLIFSKYGKGALQVMGE